MKNLIWAVVILVVAVGFMLECRYSFVIVSPIVARIDRFTGNVWIVNSGIWRKVQNPPLEPGVQQKSVVVGTTAKTK